MTAISHDSIRWDVAMRYLRGDGIEIGALHNPMKVPDQARVKYVDRMTVAELRTHYPELNDLSLVEADIVDDGETLGTITDNSLDFIIANHMLEHCENPLGAMRQHLKKLKIGGTAYYALPNKHMTFDKDRVLTSFSHLVRDDKDGAHHSRTSHYTEVVEITEKKTGVDAQARLKKLMDMNYSIHFHVWNDVTFYSFLLRARNYLGNCFQIETYQLNHTEMICVLRKIPPQTPPFSIRLHEMLQHIKNLAKHQVLLARLRAYSASSH